MKHAIMLGFIAALFDLWGHVGHGADLTHMVQSATASFILVWGLASLWTEWRQRRSEQTEVVVVQTTVKLEVLK